VFMIVSLVAISHVKSQNRRPTISFITQPEIVTDIGGDIEMKCTIQYASDYPVIWMKLDSLDRSNDLPITTGTTLILRDPRFNVEYEKQTSTYTLKIYDIQETDDSIYQFQVIIALSDRVHADVPLIVRRPPIISDNSTRSVVTWEGNRAVLKCYASGNPKPDIYWRRQNNKVLPTNSSIFKGNELVFPHVTKEQRGTYYCVATNVVGRGARRNIDLEVEHTPVIKIPRKMLGQALQFDMDLECKIEAYPPQQEQLF
jgi:neuronal growth regulator 1